MDVSVWLALDLLVVNKLCHKLVLEPASHEDLEAVLAETEPGRATSVLQLKNYRLVVQAKLRSGDAWSAPAMKSLLEYGGADRQSVADRLSDPDIRYVLVTSAALNGEAKGLYVRRPGLWPKAATMATSIANALPQGSEGRVAVIANEDTERLMLDIKDLLVNFARVPNADWEACRDALRAEARLRMLGASGGRWFRDDVERVIREHDGYLASSPELANFVRPTNWEELLRAMREKHAALIVGQSGTGKTLSTQKLYEDLRQQMPKLKRVSITHGSQQLLADRTPEPVLFDVSDPWGKYSFEPDSRPWNDELAKAFAGASHNRLFVATTRKDVADSGEVLKLVRPWIIPLEAENYGDIEMAQIYTSRIDNLPWALRVPVGRAQTKVLKELRTPLEVQKYFDAVTMLDRSQFGDEERFIAEAIRSAHQNSIEQTVVDQIEARADIRAAAVIWALLKVSDKFSLSRLRELEEELASRDPQMMNGVAPLVQFFVAARNLKQTEDTISYYHPRVEAGIEQALQRKRLTTAETLKNLISCWVLSDERASTWGASLSAELLAAIPKKTGINVRPDERASAQIDQWFGDCIADATRKLDADLRLAAAAGSKASSQSEVARYLLHRSDNTHGFGLEYWGNLRKDAGWYELHRTATTTRPLVERFVRDVLPWEQHWYPVEFGRDLKRLVPEITPVFLEAAHSIVTCGVMRSDDAIAEGALDDLEGFEGVIDEALLARIPSEEEAAKSQELHLALVNAEYSEEYAEHLAEGDEDGYTAGEFIKAYVVRVRKIGDWRRLAGHRHSAKLLYFWLRELLADVNHRALRDGESEVALDPEELDGIFACANGSKDEAQFWELQTQRWSAAYLPALATRVEVGSHSADVRLQATNCIITNDVARFADIIRRLCAEERTLRLVEIALELARLGQRQRANSDHASAVSASIAMLPLPYPELASGFSALLSAGLVNVGEEGRSTVQSLAFKSEDVRRLAVAVGNRTYTGWLPDVQWLLNNATDDDVAREAAQALAREGLGQNLVPLLNHHFAAVRAVGLTGLGMISSLPLSDTLLSMATDKGSGVRKALVALIQDRVHPAHLSTLLDLTRDQYSERSRYLGHVGEFTIARSALKALRRYSPLSPSTAQTLVSTASNTEDSEVRTETFDLLATECGVEGQTLLFDLATQRGRLPVKRDAASALLQPVGIIAPEIVARISPAILSSHSAAIASRLAIVLATQGELKAVREAADALAANANRRALILLLIRPVLGRDDNLARSLAELLPSDHLALQWALGGEIDWSNDEALSDLASPEVCREVFIFMRPPQNG